ncbi:MAG: hypothetical protein QMC34_03890 [Flavobacteriales bacterium]|jgi:hypothetical protein|tara:strand:- start:957 stop:1331 length:375 start_codon:yes stop_codon:yes gene_type:complete
MKPLIVVLSSLIIMLLCLSCNNADKTINNDPQLVGKWLRKNKYHLDLYPNGIGSIDKNALVTENIKKHKRERINWVTFNNNFILFNSDEKVKGFSYQVINDTLFLRQPEDNLEFFVRNDKKKSE